MNKLLNHPLSQFVLNAIILSVVGGIFIYGCIAIVGLITGGRQ
jgi:hypothetical protein